MPEKQIFDIPTEGLGEYQDSTRPDIAFITRFASETMIELGWPDNLGTAINVRHDWMEEELAARETTAAEDMDNSELGLDVATGTGVRFRANDHIQVQGSDEIMTVTSIATDTLTVVRGALGTVAEASLTGVEVFVVSRPAF